MARHPVDLLSFVCGLLVLSVGLLLLSGNLGHVPMEWVGPLAAIGLGAVIARAAYSARPSSAAEPEADEV